MKTSRSVLRAGEPIAWLEVGTDTIKLLLTRQTRAGLAVDNLFLRKIPGGGAPLTETLADAFRRVPRRTYRLVGCVPRPMVNLRTLELPSTDPDEIADMVDFQAGRQTPYSKDEVLLDYRLLGSRREGYTRVMLVIVQRSLLRQYFYVLDDLGAEVAWMTASSEGLLHWYRHFAREPTEGVAAILDIDAGYSDFVVLAGHDVIFSRCLRLGATRLLEHPEAGWADLALEIRPLLEGCRAEAQGIAPSRIVLSGAGARIPGLAGHLQSALNLPVRSHDETKDPRLIGSTEDMAAFSRTFSLTALVGLAAAPDMLQINLMPETVKLRHAALAQAERWGGLSRAAISLLMALSLYVTTRFRLQQQEYNQLCARTERLMPARRKAERMFEIRTIVREYRRPELSMAHILSELHPRVPSTLSLDAVDIDVHRERCRMSLSGHAASIRDIRSLMTELEKSPRFSAIREEGPIVKDPRTNRFRFKVIGLVEGSE